MKVAGTLIGLIFVTITLLMASAEIGAWEKQNGYPYGRMCDPNIFNLYHSTCPVR
jgi:hypothetical protein